jgi:uncharacterized protein (DUF1810 family)
VVTLERFVQAQEPLYDAALAELRRGQKSGHWIWFVFPQLAGLGHTPTAQHYGLSGEEEAIEYLAHPVLGTRLRECTHALTELPGVDPVAVLGPVDALKLRSSMTLFAEVSNEPVFRQVLEQYYAGKPDELTLELLGRRPGP